MKVLIVTYCFGAAGEQALIGCYKRSLRLAVALDRRGHEVVIYCTGRDFFHDELTRWAQSHIRYIDIPLSPTMGDDPRVVRDTYRATLAALDLDMVIISEAPMAGTLLEATLTAIELKIPVVVVDNTYYPGFAHYFLRMYGAIADGLILTGPSALHTGHLPPTVCEIPLLIEIATDEAMRRYLTQIAAPCEPLVAILGYDAQVEQLGINLVRRLDSTRYHFVVITPEPERAIARVRELPPALQTQFTVVKPPTEPLLFGLLKLSKLNIGKIGFMQIAESLTLGTPFIGLQFDGYLHRDDMPTVFRPFMHATSELGVDEPTLHTAQRLLELHSDAVTRIHEGPLDAAEQAVGFLERLSRAPRSDTTEACARLGFGRRLLVKAIKVAQGAGDINLLFARCCRLRRFAERELFIVICGYVADGQTGFLRLWGQRHTQPWLALRSLRRARTTETHREIYAHALLRGIVLEKDLGEHTLPGCITDDAS